MNVLYFSQLKVAKVAILIINLQKAVVKIYDGQLFQLNCICTNELKKNCKKFKVVQISDRILYQDILIQTSKKEKDLNKCLVR